MPDQPKQDAAALLTANIQASIANLQSLGALAQPLAHTRVNWRPIVCSPGTSFSRAATAAARPTPPIWPPSSSPASTLTAGHSPRYA